MFRALFSILSLSLVSCSHHIKLADTSPDYPFSPELVREAQKNFARFPASESSDESSKSSRRVYFSALYYQYLTLGNHLDEVSQLNSCPQFHHDKLETESYLVPQFSMIKLNKEEKNLSPYFPETAFNKNFSIQDHFLAVKNEITTLCEEGVSDNYFKFDNLITHYASKSSFHRHPDSMRSVLKIPVFANYYLLKMFQSSQRYTTVHPHEKQMIYLSRTHWFQDYVSKAQILREKMIQTKMVQR
jgi:hypothetical protein